MQQLLLLLLNFRNYVTRYNVVCLSLSILLLGSVLSLLLLLKLPLKLQATKQNLISACFL